MSSEISGGDTGGELPQSEGAVPRGREGISAIRGDYTVRDNVRVTVE